MNYGFSNTKVELLTKMALKLLFLKLSYEDQA